MGVTRADVAELGAGEGGEVSIKDASKFEVNIEASMVGKESMVEGFGTTGNNG